ncbi:DUF7079 family protein [Sphingomonas sp.]|uniref:DUF7079 family protein n=1 Tax=Sphingomonas sp. TaxID=28214 RepID=UPI002ED97336
MDDVGVGQVSPLRVAWLFVLQVGAHDHRVTSGPCGTPHNEHAIQSSSRPCAGIHREANWKQAARSHRPRRRGSRHKAGMTERGATVNDPIADVSHVRQFLGMVHSDAEIEKRLPVWHALSDVFLDTKLSDEDYTEIDAALRNSAYSRILLKEIFEDEVAPAFVTNLLDVAGEWTSWTEDEVREIMLRSLR